MKEFLDQLYGEYLVFSRVSYVSTVAECKDPRKLLFASYLFDSFCLGHSAMNDELNNQKLRPNTSTVLPHVFVDELQQR